MIVYGAAVECTPEQREVMDIIDKLTPRQRQNAIKVLLRIRNSSHFAWRVRATPAIIVHMISDAPPFSRTRHGYASQPNAGNLHPLPRRSLEGRGEDAHGANFKTG